MLAGGPLPLPGTAAGSVDAGSVLLSVVAPSEGGGVRAEEEVVTGELLPASTVAPELPAGTNVRSVEDPVPAWVAGLLPVELPTTVVVASPLEAETPVTSRVVPLDVAPVIGGDETVTVVVLVISPLCVAMLVDATVVDSLTSVVLESVPVADVGPEETLVTVVAVEIEDFGAVPIGATVPVLEPPVEPAGAVCVGAGAVPAVEEPESAGALAAALEAEDGSVPAVDVRV